MKEMLEKSIPKQKCAVLFSGGIDSLVLAKLMKDNKINFETFTIGLDGSKDMEFP